MFTSNTYGEPSTLQFHQGRAQSKALADVLQQFLKSSPSVLDTGGPRTLVTKPTTPWPGISFDAALTARPPRQQCTYSSCPYILS